MKKLILLLCIFMTACICKKHTQSLSPEPAAKTNEADLANITNFYFWWEIEKIEEKYYDKKSNTILEDGFYSININNCIDSDDIIIKTGDVDKKGEIKNGFYDGKWIYIYEKDTLKIENYNSKGLLDGEYIIKNNSQNIKYSTTFINGNGYYKDYCFKQDVLKEEGSYVNGKKNGKWIQYDSLGKLIRTIYYKNGKLE